MTVALDLTGKTAIVTGAAGGIGAAVTGWLEDAGAIVIGFDRRGDGAPCARFVEGDVTRSADLDKVVQQALSDTGRLDLRVDGGQYL